jgi:ADP-heptose:LPS heptosyltransferase
MSRRKRILSPKTWRWQSGFEHSGSRKRFRVSDLHRRKSPPRSRKHRRTNGENYAILNPAGGWTTKLWSAENFGALADKLWEETI